MSYVVALAWPFVALAALAVVCVVAAMLGRAANATVRNEDRQKLNRLAIQIEGSLVEHAELAKRLEKLESLLKAAPPAAGKDPGDRLKAFR